jgi:hypothetical protein
MEILDSAFVECIMRTLVPLKGCVIPFDFCKSYPQSHQLFERDAFILLTQEDNRSNNVNSAEAKKLFDRLRRFRLTLEKSLQRGPNRFGFLKKRPFGQWDTTVATKYFLTYFCYSSKSVSLPGAPASTETLGILKQTRALSGIHQGAILRREIRELETLYWATRESDIASLILMSGFFVFIASILFMIARIFSIQILVDFAFWLGIPSLYFRCHPCLLPLGSQVSHFGSTLVCPCWQGQRR